MKKIIGIVIVIFVMLVIYSYSTETGETSKEEKLPEIVKTYIEVKYPEVKGLNYNDDATLFLDGKKVGKLTQSEKTTFEVKCKPGHHKVYVQRNGLFGDKNTNKISFNVNSDPFSITIVVKEKSLGRVKISVENNDEQVVENEPRKNIMKVMGKSLKKVKKKYRFKSDGDYALINGSDRIEDSNGDGCIDSIAIFSGTKYCLEGVYPGMSSTQAEKILGQYYKKYSTDEDGDFFTDGNIFIACNYLEGEDMEGYDENYIFNVIAWLPDDTEE